MVQLGGLVAHGASEAPVSDRQLGGSTHQK